MTSTRLKEAALSQFTNNGYEGASLATIAQEVGIKKQSIYTHFRGKDELFLEVFHDSLQRELQLQFMKHYFHNNTIKKFDLAGNGQQILVIYRNRFLSSNIWGLDH